MVSWDLMVFNHLVMTNIAMENPLEMEGIAGKIIYKSAKLSMAFLVITGWYPNSWLVYFMETPMKMDDDWGYPYFRKNLQLMI